MFRSARLKLTTWYLIILMCISIGFSIVIYKSLSNEVDRFSRIQRLRIERRFEKIEPFSFDPQKPRPPVMDLELVNEIKERVVVLLIIINIGILFVAGGLSYFLAGKTLRPIKEMVDEQNRFVTDASHELRTPLTSLKSSFEVYLRDKNLTLDDAKKVLSESIEDVSKLQRLSDSLLQLSQYQKTNNNIKFENNLLSEIVSKAKSKIQPLAKHKNITIKTEIIEQKIFGDKYGLIDLLIILLDNAVKYSKEKSTVYVYTKQLNKYIEISIKDNGVGINIKDISYIFNRFYRAETSRCKEKINGYGLGLAIAKKIVEMHKGNISVQSEVEKGSMFIVRLPRK